MLASVWSAFWGCTIWQYEKQIAFRCSLDMRRSLAAKIRIANGQISGLHPEASLWGWYWGLLTEWFQATAAMSDHSCVFLWAGLPTRLQPRPSPWSTLCRDASVFHANPIFGSHGDSVCFRCSCCLSEIGMLVRQHWITCLNSIKAGFLTILEVVGWQIVLPTND